MKKFIIHMAGCCELKNPEYDYCESKALYHEKADNKTCKGDLEKRPNYCPLTEIKSEAEFKTPQPQWELILPYNYNGLGNVP